MASWPHQYLWKEDLSLPLHVIQGEITKNINKNDSVIGIKIPNYKNQIKI